LLPCAHDRSIGRRAGRDARPVLIRAATADDATAICRIYNQGIEDRQATLETELRTPTERAEWLAGHGPRHPVVVAEVDGQVAAWASLEPFSARRAYDHVAQFSIYVARERRGQGVGTALLRAIEEQARALGYHKLCLAALNRNVVGKALYVRQGFREVGVYREQGRLDGQWVDTVVMEKILS
jgi:L-amino acid N-acyltransferase YncA